MCCLRRGGATTAGLFQPNGKKRNIGRSDTADAGCLTKSVWTDFVQALLGFALQAHDGIIIHVIRHGTGFLASHAINLLALAQDVPFILEIGFNEGPEFHGELLPQCVRQILPAIFLPPEPVIELDALVDRFPHEARGFGKCVQFIFCLLVALGTGQSEGAGNRAETLVGVILPEEETIFGSTGEHPIGFGAPLRDEVIDHDAEIGLVPGQDERVVAENLEGRIGPREKALTRGLFITGGPIDLTRKVEAFNLLCLESGGELGWWAVIVFDGVSRPDDFGPVQGRE